MGHVCGDPVSVNGEGGHHGGADCGGELEAMGLEEMDAAEKFEGRDGEAEGMR